MKTINEDIKRMMSLMVAQHGVIYPLINEQSGIWSDVQGTENGYKEVVKSFASVPCMDPKSGKQFATKIDSERRLFLYIGAKLRMIYREGGGPPKTQAEADKSPYFKFILVFYFTYVKGQTDYNGGNKYDTATEKDIWFVQATKLADGKFYSKITYQALPEEVRREYAQSVTNLNDKDYSSQKSLLMIQTDTFPTNIDGAAPGLLAQINTELAKYGYPDIPNVINSNIVTL
jgi:hypothetical protein